MKDYFLRTELLLGKKAMKKLANSKVAVFGIGGVGSYTSEALVRSGLGNIVLVDYDIIDVSNINRQIHATSKTVGQLKVNVMKDRLLEINPDLNIVVYDECYSEENAEELLSPSYNYVVDAIDMVSSKINLIEKCKALKIPIISCMGAGNKLDPTMFQVGDIYETFNCPLAKVMRKELKKRGIQDLKVVWSKENPIKINLRKSDNRKTIPGSVSFVPSVAGLIIASEVVKDLVMEV
ncbi:tRNA A37 threonylcarbamoyladenosine dehydratase [Keratinibaculum paraultunense]|uniref:tRNA A37 threonylcarbamoyladenosine dehydratase n=1 Tax=Keratinibaculum paraultunense TaxID=1278232 RepID=A0A4R3KW57_9FIRM|nr:tRNA threonylcarbamoyladenosine dehydratase [Keratinibaculum paraultunense]QQY78750.1 tRNA threonylcarbamoyladenosine dehydratase [Keratinibaculum paraultunense]TCS89570.1 tRNA A37 threonylcarbamoyladenosine dehydratase [Keratinibaculum paraultunense]